MKKVLLVLLLCLLIVGCGNSKSKSKDKKEEAPKEVEAKILDCTQDMGVGTFESYVAQEIDNSEIVKFNLFYELPLEQYKGKSDDEIASDACKRAKYIAEVDECFAPIMDNKVVATMYQDPKAFVDQFVGENKYGIPKLDANTLVKVKALLEQQGFTCTITNKTITLD